MADVPGGWKLRLLPEAIDFREGPGILAKDFREDGVPLVRLAGVTSGSLLDGCNYLDPGMVARKWSHFRLAQGDTLLSTSASLGRIARVDRSAVGAIPYTGLIRMRPASAEVDQGYVALLLGAPSFEHQVAAMGAGSVMQHFGPSHLRQMTVLVPPLPEQRAIASVLGALDDKIESNRRLLPAQRQTRSLRFANLCRTRSSRVPLDAIAEHLKGTVQPAATPDEAFEQFSIPAFDATGDPEVCLGRTMASGKTPLPPEPVVLISKLNPRTPRVWAPVPSGVGRAVCSPEFLVLRPKPDISYAWLDACVRHDERFYNDLLAGVTGTTGSRQRVKPADVLAATVPDATAEEIAEWTALAGPMIGREAALDRERRTLTAIRDALLPKLVSGQIRVPLSDDPEEQVGAAVEALDA